MSSNKKFDRFLTEQLKKTGRPFSIEMGRKHQKIFLDGRLISVISHGSSQKHEKVFERDLRKALTA